MRIEQSELTNLQNELDKRLPEHIWLHILETFVPSGAADGLQLRQATGLERDKLRRAMDKMESSAVGFPPIIRTLDHSIIRAGMRGRAPSVFLLGETGADLLNRNGYPDIHACNLSEDGSLSHALCMLSVHLAAKQAGLEIITDQFVRYDDGRYIRPDHRIISASGKQVLLEIEQSATRNLVPRIIESLDHKQSFFNSKESTDFLPEVRMLLNVPPGKVWKNTIKVWKEACNQVVQKRNQPLSFTLLVISLEDFLAAPEWEERSSRWQEPSSYFPSTEIKGDAASGNVPAAVALKRSSRDDLVLLSALLQQYNETLSNRTIPNPELVFFDVIVEIYSPSHPRELSFWKMATVPHASIYLLKRYLEIHPVLLQKLQRSIHYGKGRIRWNTTTILHRMQQVLNTFMSYHGWQTNGPIRTSAVLNDWDGPGPFGVKVQRYGGWKFSTDHKQEEQLIPALTWILWALFEYAEEIGLGKPEFW